MSGLQQHLNIKTSAPITKFAYTGKSLFSPLLDIVVLLLFILIFQIAANHLYKKFNE